MARAEQFVESWLLENYQFEGYPAPEDEDDPQAKQLAADCAQAALEEGISHQDIENELGNLETYMRHRIERFVDEHVQNQADNDR